MIYPLRLLCATLLLFIAATPASALTYESVSQQIAAFEKSGKARFAPASMKKVQAYQGASMLAYEEQKKNFSKSASEEQSQALQNALEQTVIALNEAKNNAQSFTATFRSLLQLEAEANKAYVFHHNPQMMPDVKVATPYNKAKQQLEIAITSTEQGQLNLSDQASKNAEADFQACITAALPGLVEQSSRALSQASDLGAKRLAPTLWQLSESAYDALEAYQEDMEKPESKREGVKRPQSIGLAYEYAVFTQKMAIAVKDWRHDNGSHEKMALESRQMRLDIAMALAMPLDYAQVGIDIEASELIAQIKALKQAAVKAEQQHQATIAQMNASFAEQLKQQHLTDEQNSLAQIADLRSAFSSKLEKETFETKRQKKVRDLFAADEAEIIANLDGSLMIRAKKIQFGPSSSKVDGQYFDFLARIKDALTLYPNRAIKIEGHTDSTGEEKENRVLSLKRAEAVQEFLIAAGIEADRIRAFGFGEVKPIASNMYKTGRAMNRRIDITIEAK